MRTGVLHRWPALLLLLAILTIASFSTRAAPDRCSFENPLWTDAEKNVYRNVCLNTAPGPVVRSTELASRQVVSAEFLRELLEAEKFKWINAIYSPEEVSYWPQALHFANLHLNSFTPANCKTSSEQRGDVLMPCTHSAE